MTVDNTQLSMKMDRTTLTGNQLWADWDKKRLGIFEFDVSLEVCLSWRRGASSK